MIGRAVCGAVCGLVLTVGFTALILRALAVT